jgi:hypothetical protein
MSETLEAIRVMGFGGWLWARTLYRPFQRWAHQHNWHHCKVLWPEPDGSRQHWCQWCGLRYQEPRRFLPDGTDLTKDISF